MSFFNVRIASGKGTIIWEKAIEQISNYAVIYKQFNLDINTDSGGDLLQLKIEDITLVSPSLEGILKELEIDANVEHSEFSSARGMGADVIVGQEIHTEIFKDLDPVVVTVETFTDKKVIKSQIEETFKENGWL